MLKSKKKLLQAVNRSIQLSETHHSKKKKKVGDCCRQRAFAEDFIFFHLKFREKQFEYLCIEDLKSPSVHTLL